jgi:hypothetical protein
MMGCMCIVSSKDVNNDREQIALGPKSNLAEAVTPFLHVRIVHQKLK